MTSQGYSKLLEHEGEKLFAYQDSLGFWTIGVGHLIDRRKGGSITQQVSRLLLEDDIARFMASCRVEFAWFDALDPVRQDVVVNLAFNLGIEGLKGFVLMIKAIEQQNWQAAAFELFNSQWRQQVQKTRVDDLVMALETGKWD